MHSRPRRHHPTHSALHLAIPRPSSAFALVSTITASAPLRHHWQYHRRPAYGLAIVITHRLLSTSTLLLLAFGTSRRCLSLLLAHLITPVDSLVSYYPSQVYISNRDFHDGQHLVGSYCADRLSFARYTCIGYGHYYFSQFVPLVISFSFRFGV
jgi:hypothetical protein